MTTRSGAAVSLSEGEARRLRFQSQLLGGDRGRGRDPAALAVRARSSGLREHDVTRALEIDRSLVRTWLLRGTLHIAAAEDIGWMLGLLGPRFAARGARTPPPLRARGP